MLELHRVSKWFGSQRALDCVDLALPPGSTTVLIGPSGCGKSTILRLLVGLLTADQGTVTLDGAVLDRRKWQAARRRIGYMIQDGGLFPHQTLRQNTVLMGRLSGWSRRQVDDRLEALAVMARLPTELLDRYPLQVSGGQRQRVALMRALFLDPDYLLLDEPLGALDPQTRAELQAELKQIFQTLGKAVVLVTHDLAEAAYFADRVALLCQGRLVQRGTFQQLAQQPASPFVRQFLQSQRSPLEPGREVHEP